MSILKYTGICPICKTDVDRKNMSVIQFQKEYICLNCRKNISSKDRDAISNINKKDIEYLRELVATPKKSFWQQLNEVNNENLQNKKIVKTTILNTINDSRKKAGSSLVRGAVGGALFGGVGVVAGAMSGKNKIESKTTFLVEYASGKKETKTVDNNSKEYKELCMYL